MFNYIFKQYLGLKFLVKKRKNICLRSEFLLTYKTPIFGLDSECHDLQSNVYIRALKYSKI